MVDIKTLLILIPALPLTATLLTAALGKRVLRGRSHVPVVTALTMSFVASIVLVFQMQERIYRHPVLGVPVSRPVEVTLWRWADLGDSLPSSFGREAGGEGFRDLAAFHANSPHPSPPLKKGATAGLSSSEWKELPENTAGQASSGTQTPGNRLFQRAASPLPAGEGTARSIDVALQADPLTAAMLAIVTCISTLVAIYSIGYMRGDAGYWRFFTYIGLFVFSMTMLVSASNFVLLYVFWELVGLCSYLLIGFWYERPAAAAAGKKAFLVNRIGDAGFLLGIFFIWTTYGTLDFSETFAAVEKSAIGWQTTAICLLLMLGACGKSAQLPLHVWLPDAMEGPTPVSALIHAATMVTAGVYMVARCWPLFAASPDAQYVVALIGGVTALLGAIIAITQTDLKRILAYSTISHLGYMFLALGTGTVAGVTAGMFHLMTHAFFKALLFLGAGNVMHAMGGVIDIRRFGGLRRRLPVTHWTFLFGCLAIAGVVPFAGFWSKDAILLVLRERACQDGGEMFSYLLATSMLGVLLIDFYMFRPFFLTFYGPERIPPEAGHHAHESPGTMTGPLVVLAFGSLVVGAYFEWTHGFTRFLAATPSLAYLQTRPQSAVAPAGEQGNLGALSTGITLFGIALTAMLYLRAGSGPARLARLMDVFGLYSLSLGKFFFDPIYTVFVVWPLLGVARLAALFDHYAIDSLVDLVGRVPKRFGAALRPTQNGLVQFYALAMMVGLFMLLGALLM